jgi:uncharacterized protein
MQQQGVPNRVQSNNRGHDMKKLIAPFLFCLFIVSAALAEDKEPPHVTVFGTATTEVVPDQMNWSLRVQTRGLKLDAVAQEHDTNVQGVLALLKNSNLKETNIQTASMQFGENWEYKARERVRNGYIATTMVSFKLNDFDLYRKLWLGLAQMPSVSVESVNFDQTKRIEYQDETREKAIRVAKEKAGALARAIGSEIGEPLFIEEEQDEFVRPMMFNNRMAAASAAPQDEGESMAPGTIPIKVRVHASFRLVTNPK